MKKMMDEIYSLIEEIPDIDEQVIIKKRALRFRAGGYKYLLRNLLEILEMRYSKINKRFFPKDSDRGNEWNKEKKMKKIYYGIVLKEKFTESNWAQIFPTKKGRDLAVSALSSREEFIYVKPVRFKVVEEKKEVIHIRNISDKQAKLEIGKLSKRSKRVLYFSDIAEKLQLEIEQVVRIVKILIEEKLWTKKAE